jgi:hypothetical protein
MPGTLLTILLPIMAAMAAGYAWVRAGRPFDNATLAPLAADVALPCLIFAALATAEIQADAFAAMALAAAASLAALACIGAALLGAARLSLRTYLPSVTWGNAGYLGIPLALYAFGPAGLGHAAAFSATSLVFNSVFGQAVAAGRANLGGIARNPLVHAVLAGVLVRLLRVDLPDWLLGPVRLFGGLAVPLTLMMVGASLARLKVAAFGRALAFSVLRTGIGAAVALAMALLFGLEGTARSVLVLQCAMPVAVLSYILAQRWDNEPEEVAGLVVVSTWTAALSIPVMLSFMVAP